jgi:glutathione S-transferase
MEEMSMTGLWMVSRDLGRYDGTTNKDKYLVDVVSDIYINWRV